MRQLFITICLAFMFGWLSGCTGDQSPGAPQGSATQVDTDPSTGPAPTTEAPVPTSGSELTTDATTTTGPDEVGTTEPASTGTEPPGCGDGIVGPGEACDGGFAANLESAACLPNCTLATCGDGHVQAGKEACDLGPGNGNAYGGCTPVTCLWGPRCGDGVVSPGHELCDPGMPVDPGDEIAACAPTCRFDGRIAFISSQAFTGDLGGISGADLKCQALAAGFDPARAHTYRAWLSDGVSAPATTFEHGVMFAATPYVLRNGVKVAASFEDLVQHGPAVGITLSDTYEVLVNKKVWTHTTHEGKAVPDTHHCDQWTSDSFKTQAMAGWNIPPEGSPELKAWADQRWWTRYVELNCNNSLPRLYCFEN